MNRLVNYNYGIIEKIGVLKSVYIRSKDGFVVMFYVYALLFLTIYMSLLLNMVSAMQFVTMFIMEGVLVILMMTDGLSICLIGLSIFLSLICFVYSWFQKYRLREFQMVLMLIDLLVVNMFLQLDLLVLFILYEVLILPVFLYIGLWGSRVRKVEAAYKFFLYALIGSLLMLMGLIFVLMHVGITNMMVMSFYSMSKMRLKYVYLFFIVSVLIKIPMFPFYAWLPEAHVEASTVGSIFLAGILLKIGIFIYFRFLVYVYFEVVALYSLWVMILGMFSMLLALVLVLYQVDLKRIVAFSSVVHMNVALMGIMVMNVFGYIGCFVVLLSHGLVSSGLFLMVGFIYDRYKTRFIYYYGGIMQIMPLYSGVLFLMVMANIGLPGTFSFIGEFLLYVAFVQFDLIIYMFMIPVVVLTTFFMLWMYTRLTSGILKGNFILNFGDLSKREVSLLIMFLVFILWYGENPNGVLELLSNEMLFLSI